MKPPIKTLQEEHSKLSLAVAIMHFETSLQWTQWIGSTVEDNLSIKDKMVGLNVSSIVDKMAGSVLFIPQRFHCT